MADGVFSKMLEKYRVLRESSHANAKRELLRRNNAVAKPGYIIQKEATVFKDGREVTEFKLYQLIDASVVTISSDVEVSVEEGKQAALEMKPSWGPQKSASSPSTKTKTQSPPPTTD